MAKKPKRVKVQAVHAAPPKWIAIVKQPRPENFEQALATIEVLEKKLERFLYIVGPFEDIIADAARLRENHIEAGERNWNALWEFFPEEMKASGWNR